MIKTIGNMVHMQRNKGRYPSFDPLTSSWVEELYMDWRVNYHSIAKFAEDHLITEEQALLLIEQGRKIHDIFCDLHKALK